ncbi:zinc ribbon domain-containing protein [Tsukamurella sp. 8F]|uniref:FmdB family zinc ribbon protein n=1 Tax=unclassified Tsukamurella TaxID=2633480 RepID=UPI0023BA1C83|nr:MULTISPECIES: FmdB family zinc ribbon protein [unclassified Tsukamurella]MDF0532383.1 zinc ribbon domain-containing protein [Tsukamurella sp. 8J]MDF0588631.1 zinc ribbon domain-containing protein [Tsukamurella sp. 8F]
MPTYSYKCTECDNQFDIVQSFSDDALTVCPECGGKLRKVFNSVGVVFKGSGFYRTDSRSKADTSAKPAKESNSSSDSSSKPAAKTEKAASSTAG